MGTKLVNVALVAGEIHNTVMVVLDLQIRGSSKISLVPGKFIGKLSVRIVDVGSTRSKICNARPRVVVKAPTGNGFA